MRKPFKLFFKAISWLLIIFIIVTTIVAITKLSRPRTISVDLDSMSEMQREIFLRRYGGNLVLTKMPPLEYIKDDVIDYYKMLSKGELGWTYRIVRTVDSMGNPVVRRENIDPVGKILKTGFNRSIKFLSVAMGISLVVGIIKGVFDSKKDKRNNSTFKLFTTVMGLSIPVIFLAPLLQLFALWIKGKYKINIPIQGHETIKHMILPIITLSILPTMYIARITAVAVDKAYENEYVRTAISKGNSRLRVLWIHVFRNAIVEVVGSLPSALTIIISDLAIVEYLFDYKGLTNLMVDYYEQGQSDVVTGGALVLCGIFLFFFLIFKLAKFLLEPEGRVNAL